mmetsp:Transcript_34222/g.76689  ORF Transcript_34222/g.76689 Transcript_34222/m.76689 type:complete len:132 (+) Transcript_34222:79-474(+)
MAFMYLIFVYIAVVGFGVAVFIYGKAEGNSLFDRAYRFVAVHLPGGLKWALATIFGPRGPAALDSAWQYVCWTSNPLVQIFYVCIVAGSVSTEVAIWFSCCTATRTCRTATPRPTTSTLASACLRRASLCG